MYAGCGQPPNAPSLPAFNIITLGVIYHAEFNYSGTNNLPKRPPKNVPIEEEGLRERKRRETHRRIAEAGMRLFLTNS